MSISLEGFSNPHGVDIKKRKVANDVWLEFRRVKHQSFIQI